MNKRIRELAEQADIVFGHYNNNEVICSAIDIEKFAELIVQECVNICESGSSTQMTCGGAAMLIKQKFGVEE